MKNRRLVGILQILIILSLGISAITYVLDDNTVSSQKLSVPTAISQAGEANITVIPSPKQDKAEIPGWANDSTAQIADLGQNLALKKSAEDNGYNDIYEAINVTDGIPQTYWEGKPADYPNIVTVDLGTSKSVAKVRVRLNPEVIWSKRIQNFSVLTSSDGKTFKEIEAANDYDFDPKTGNFVLISFDKAVETRFVQLQFYKNTGASGAQISEFEVY